MKRVIAAVVLIGGYVLWNVLAWFFSEPQDSFDTYRYFQPLADPLNPGITVNFIYITLNSGQWITLTQVILATAAWSFLALAALIRLRWNPAAWVMSVVLLLLSLSTPLWSWHMLTYTESLASTALTFWLASIVWVSVQQGNALKALTPFTVAAILIALTRPQLLVFVLPTQLVILVWWWRQNKRLVPAISATVALIPFMAFATYRIYQVTEITLFKFRYALNNLVGKNASFRDYALSEMPPCEFVNQALDGPQPWNDVQALDRTLMNSCPETWIWFQSDAVNMQRWMLARPTQTATEFLAQMQNIVLPLGPQASALPSLVSDLLLNPLYPLLWALGYAVLGIVFAVLNRVRPKVTLLSALGILTIVATSLLHLLFVWGADGDSVERHVFPLIPLFAVALFVFPSTWPRVARSSDVSRSSDVTHDPPPRSH